MSKRKIVYVTGTRADFGLMTSVLQEINKNNSLSLHIYATGMHLMPEYGDTIKEVKEKFPRTKIIKAIFGKNGRENVAIFMANFINRFSREISQNRPDLILTLGDRPEMLCATSVSVYLGIPTAHIQGGERTYTVDEIVRHAITKLSNLHLVATHQSAERIEKMGEEKWRIYVVGAPGLDAILKNNFLTRQELCYKLGLDANKKIILLIQHPVSLEEDEAGKQIEETIEAVKTFNLQVVIIYPDADPGSSRIIQVLERYRNEPMFHIFKSLPRRDFLSLEKEAAVLVGNSSAWMIESSSFKTPVVNVGNRQIGRQRGKNVIDVDYDQRAITAAVDKSLNSRQYIKGLKRIKNPWGDGKTGLRIAKILETIKIDKKLLTKQITY
jgi:UDP-hydrolysing UDP-N-acetyl-D-glucosamine 2-epimerase